MRERSCAGKGVYHAGTARAVAEQARARGDTEVRPYRCLFDHPGLWHVGHNPGMDAIEVLAKVMRAGLHGPASPH